MEYSDHIAKLRETYANGESTIQALVAALKREDAERKRQYWEEKKRATPA
jgi:hypothetical protein